MKTVVGINTLTMIDQFVYASHINLAFRLGRNTKDDFYFVQPRRMTIDKMRNFTAKVALETESDYILFIDDDVQVPPNTYDKLKEGIEKHGFDVLAGVTYIRSYPFRPMVFNFLKEETDFLWMDFKDHADKQTGLLECDAVGFSCCMIKTSCLRDLLPPYFLTGPNHTEDVYFCQKLKDYNPGAKIGVHTGVETAHLIGPEFIHSNNLEIWRKHAEEEFPEIKAPKGHTWEFVNG